MLLKTSRWKGNEDPFKPKNNEGSIKCPKKLKKK